MKIYVATVRPCKNKKEILEGYRNRRKEDQWKKEYASVCIADSGLPHELYVGACIDVIWDAERKCFKEK